MVKSPAASGGGASIACEPYTKFVGFDSRRLGASLDNGCFARGAADGNFVVLPNSGLCVLVFRGLDLLFAETKNLPDGYGLFSGF